MLCAILARFGPSACPSSQHFRLPSLACTRAPRKPRRRPSCSSPLCLCLPTTVVIRHTLLKFNSAKNQRAIMSGLSLQRCSSVVDNVRQMLWMTDIAQMCIKIVSNISLNNYSKSLTDGHTKSKSLRKLSTLTK